MTAVTYLRPLDHRRLILRLRSEVARFRRYFAGEALDRGQLHEVSILHEADDSCCKREPWSETLLTLLTKRDAS